MYQMGFVRLIVLFLGFTCVLACVSAIPVTRSLKSVEGKPSSVQSFFPEETTYKGESGEEMMIGYIEIARRIDIESNDYAGTGANPRHDPKTPGSP